MRRERERQTALEVFPCAHPYGSGSFASEVGAYISPPRVCRNRLLSLQSFFRRSSGYCFWLVCFFVFVLFAQRSNKTLSEYRTLLE